MKHLTKSSLLFTRNLTQIPRPEKFGKEAFSAWKPGQSERNNGVLVLLFLDDRKVRIQTGSGLEKVLPDKLCAEIIATDMGPNFRKGDYTGGIEAALNHIHECHPGRV